MTNQRSGFARDSEDKAINGRASSVRAQGWIRDGTDEDHPVRKKFPRSPRAWPMQPP